MRWNRISESDVAQATAGPSRQGHRGGMDDHRAHLISCNLTAFLERNLKPGQDAELAIHRERQEVIVFVDGEPILNCTFDDLLAGPGGSIN